MSRASLTGQAIMRFVMILIVFLIVGPPVGALTFAVAAALFMSNGLNDIPGTLWAAAAIALYGTIFSWFIGALPALAAGAIVGIRQAFFGPAPMWLAALAGLVVGLVLAGSDGLFRDANAGGAILVLVCLVASLVSWACARIMGSAGDATTTAGEWNR